MSEFKANFSKQPKLVIIYEQTSFKEKMNVDGVMVDEYVGYSLFFDEFAHTKISIT